MPIEVESAQLAQSSATETAPETSRLSAILNFSLTPERTDITPRERMFFTERLQLLLETGSPLHSAVETLAAQMPESPLRRILLAIADAVAGGATFAHALREHPQAFPPTYISLVAAGEGGGFLPRVLERLREAEEKSHELRGALMSSLSYPAFLVVFSFAVVIFVLTTVFPKFADIFDMIQDQLPITTRILMATSEWLIHGWPFLLGTLVGGTLLFIRWARSEHGRITLDSMLVKTPLIREVIIELQLVQFLYTLGLSLENGVPLLDALRVSREVASSPSFRSFLDDLERNVQEGRPFSEGFENAPLLPPLAAQMISTGEESGKLAFVSARIATFYEREWRARLALIARIAEPAMLLVMGVVVGVIVSSLLLPIFKLSTAAG